MRCVEVSNACSLASGAGICARWEHTIPPTTPPRCRRPYAAPQLQRHTQGSRPRSRLSGPICRRRPAHRLSVSVHLLGPSLCRGPSLRHATPTRRPSPPRSKAGATAATQRRRCASLAKPATLRERARVPPGVPGRASRRNSARINYRRPQAPPVRILGSKFHFISVRFASKAGGPSGKGVGAPGRPRPGKPRE